MTHSRIIAIVQASHALAMAAAAGSYTEHIKKATFHGHPLAPPRARGILHHLRAHIASAQVWLDAQQPTTTACNGAGSGWCDCQPATEETEDTQP